MRESRGNTKALYSIVNSSLGIRHHNPLPEGKNIEVAEEFADFFLNKILTIRNELQHHPLYKPSAEDCNIFSTFSALDEDEVTRLIMKLNTKSCEMDIIPTHVLKEILRSLISEITFLVNVSLNTGIYAEQWKIAIVRPLLKKVGLDLISKNYRPVSNLMFLAKLVEAAALDQLLNHCEKNNLIPDYQSAYRKNYSCETALIKFTNDILWSMERGEAVAVMALDLSAAFDTVDHSVLLNVLNAKFGIKGTVLNWYSSYLFPQSFKVCVNNNYSSDKSLSFSVPQGSVGGPILYSCYASTLQMVIPPQMGVHGFADDHLIKSSLHPRIKES